MRWNELIKADNSKAGVIKKGNFVSPVLVHFAEMLTKDIFEFVKEYDLDEESPKEYWWYIFLECLCVTLHFIDRKSFDVLDVELRNTLMDTVFSETCKILIDMDHNQEIENFENYFSTIINLKNVEYTKYNLIIPEKDEPYANTLFWEFGKNVIRIFNKEKDARLIVPVMNSLVSGLSTYKFQELLMME